MEKTIEYNGKHYRHVATTTCDELYKKYNKQWLESVFKDGDDETFIELVKNNGESEPSMWPPEKAIEVLDYDEMIVFCFPLIRCNEQYDLYELI